MTEARIGEREQASQAWAGAPREGQVPVRADGVVPPLAPLEAAPETASARWTRRVLRVVRELAIGAAIVAMVPIGLVTTYGGRAPRTFMQSGYDNTLVKLREAEPVRRYAAAKDASIDPMQAGRALAALSPVSRSTRGFTAHPVAERYARAWTAPVPAAFGKTGSAWNGPNPTTVLQTVANGISPADVAYLKSIATAPVWPAFDLAARAPAVDLVGGRFELPFGADARAYNLPIMRFAATKELAYASVSRAAYYLAIGQPAEAEAVLQRTIGFGFVFIDNATSLIDALIGRVIVDIGRSGLRDLYRATGDPRATELAAAGAPLPQPTRPRGPLTAEEARQLQLNMATSAVLPRAVRLENLQLLAQSVCANPRELVFGPGRDVRDAYDKAGKDLARFPSERAVLDLMLNTPSLPVDPSVIGGQRSAGVVVGASTIASIIFDNPRMAYCARIITGR